MKAKDVRTKKPADLLKQKAELEAELRDWRFGNAGSRSKDVRKARKVRKDIARINTVLNETK
ncbi:MAG: Ribosomal protein [Candidatus Parcubacteria bacterium]|jgi:ribosomal protein L29